MKAAAMMVKKAFFPSKALVSPPSSLVSCFSSSSQLHHSQPWRPQQEEELRSARVCVWWDVGNCHVPAGVDLVSVPQAIKTAVRANGMNGPVQITAVADIFQLSNSTCKTLSSIGITIAHVPNDGKSGYDSISSNLLFWIRRNPPPANLFLITNFNFTEILLLFRAAMNYNILLASNEAADDICSAASIVWRWNDLVKRENLIGKHVNQPPDSPDRSCNGHSKLQVEDPYLVGSKLQ